MWKYGLFPAAQAEGEQTCGLSGRCIIIAVYTTENALMQIKNLKTG